MVYLHPFLCGSNVLGVLDGLLTSMHMQSYWLRNQCSSGEGRGEERGQRMLTKAEIQMTLRRMRARTKLVAIVIRWNGAKRWSWSCGNGLRLMGVEEMLRTSTSIIRAIANISLQHTSSDNCYLQQNGSTYSCLLRQLQPHSTRFPRTTPIHPQCCI